MLAYPIINGIENTRRHDEIPVISDSREIMLDNGFRIAEIRQTFYIFCDKNRRLGEFNDSSHPHIELAAAFLRRFICFNDLTEMIFI